MEFVLSPLYDRAYDKGYIGINEKFEILLSKELKKKSKDISQKYFASIAGSKIILPKKYYPKKEFLQFHLDQNI